jgi:hypothetical protein
MLGAIEIIVNTRARRRLDVRSPNKKEARLRFLADFNLERMPAGFEISEAGVVV